jgi:hypothetical protein
VRIVLVGELNLYTDDPVYALHHEPRWASGNRLRVIMGLRDRTYSELEKVNLCFGRWSAYDAAAEAVKLLADCYCATLFVLLGVKVSAAFAGPRPFDIALVPERHPVAQLSLPHPSGRNPVWNDTKNRRLARYVLRVAAPEIPWGEEP